MNLVSPLSKPSYIEGISVSTEAGISLYFREITSTGYPIKLENVVLLIVVIAGGIIIALGYVLLRSRRNNNRFKVRETKDYFIIE